MIVVLIIGILSTIGTLIFQSFAEKSRVKKAISEILSLQTKIKAYTVYDNLFPDSLDDIEGGNMQDPWGNPYQYTNFGKIRVKSALGSLLTFSLILQPSFLASYP